MSSKTKNSILDNVNKEEFRKRDNRPRRTGYAPAKISSL
ncbi:hypothetical protein N752_29725 [Desulforamulus aquiferis]|nr:hypothetical protein N752_29725 [Desulforamulus aquiferis]